MKRSVIFLLTLLVFGCEDGPGEIFTPVDEDPANLSGSAWTLPGAKDYTIGETRDSSGRARFCDESQTTVLIEEMVKKPIIPDVSAGGLPLWNADRTPVHADSLLGTVEDGKFCDATGIYSNAFTWGPTNEIIAFINEDTRLVESIVLTQSYLGDMRATRTLAAGTEDILMDPRERILIGTRQLDEYTSRADQATKPRSWLNHENITAMYTAIRETFFAADPVPAGYNCVEQKVCDVIYTSPDETQPQDTAIVFRDSGVTLSMTPDGYLAAISIDPVRVAPFEAAGDFDMGTNVAFGPVFKSGALPNCELDFTKTMTFGEFKDACINNDATLKQVDVTVHDSRDSVTLGFDGIDLLFKRDVAANMIFRDGELPADDDELYALTFVRQLNAPIKQFVPSNIAASFKTHLEARLKEMSPPGSLLYNFELTIPANLSTESQRIGELTYADRSGERSWLPDVLRDVRATFDAMPAEEQELVDDRIHEDAYILENFVAASLDVFSAGHSEKASSWVGLRTTDDRRWSIGYANFKFGDELYRFTVQYSLNFGAVTAVTVSKGMSTADEVFSAYNDWIRPQVGLPDEPYYLAEIASMPGNPLALDGTAIAVNGHDRQLDTVDVAISMPDGSTKTMTVPGAHMSDRSGFSRQIRGERFEFVPAHRVSLSGKETSMSFYVNEAGEIVRLVLASFKGSPSLCSGLQISYGDAPRKAIEAWRQGAGDSAYRDCDLIFNYSENGNVLDSVVSIKNRVSFTTVGNRAVTFAAWK